MIQGFSNPSCLGYHIDIIIEETDKEQGLLNMFLLFASEQSSWVSEPVWILTRLSGYFLYVFG